MNWNADQLTFNFAGDGARFVFRIIDGNTLVFEGEGRPHVRVVVSPVHLDFIFKRLLEQKPYYQNLVDGKTP